MKIVEVPFHFYPAPPGGTEVYVSALASHLSALGQEPVIAAHALENATYDWHGTRVRAYAISPPRRPADTWGEGDATAARNFGEILDDESPDIVHLHAPTSASFLLPLREARQRGIPVVYTWHDPGTSCPRGTLLRWGSEPCDGTIKPQRCAACFLHSRGLPLPMARAASWLPDAIGSASTTLGLPRDVSTALRMRSLISRYQARFRAFMSEVDRVVVLANWILPVLQVNGVDTSKVIVCPQGVPFPDRFAGLQAAPSASTRPLRLLFLGRLEPSKGLDTLLDSLRLAHDAPIILDIHGHPMTPKYLAHLKARAAQDARVRINDAVQPEDIPQLLRRYHALVVPSTGFDMAPLVVAEAHAAGLPVVGSDRGGVGELVRHGHNGLLVEAGSAPMLHDAILRLLLEPTLIDKLRSGCGITRTSKDIATEMIGVYRSLTGASRRGADVER